MFGGTVLHKHRVKENLKLGPMETVLSEWSLLGSVTVSQCNLGSHMLFPALGQESITYNKFC